MHTWHEMKVDLSVRSPIGPQRFAKAITAARCGHVDLEMRCAANERCSASAWPRGLRATATHSIVVRERARDRHGSTPDLALVASSPAGRVMLRRPTAIAVHRSTEAGACAGGNCCGIDAVRTIAHAPKCAGSPSQHRSAARPRESKATMYALLYFPVELVLASRLGTAGAGGRGVHRHRRRTRTGRDVQRGTPHRLRSGAMHPSGASGAGQRWLRADRRAARVGAARDNRGSASNGARGGVDGKMVDRPVLARERSESSMRRLMPAVGVPDSFPSVKRSPELTDAVSPHIFARIFSISSEFRMAARRRAQSEVRRRRRACRGPFIFQGAPRSINSQTARQFF